MDETTNMYPDSSDHTQFRFKKVNEIKGCFVAEIREREVMSKGLSKYIVVFDYFDKALIILLATSGSVSIPSFASVTRAPIGIVTASLVLCFQYLQES